MWINRRAKTADETFIFLDEKEPVLKVHVLCDESALLIAVSIPPCTEILYYDVVMMGNTTISTEITA